MSSLKPCPNCSNTVTESFIGGRTVCQSCHLSLEDWPKNTKPCVMCDGTGQYDPIELSGIAISMKQNEKTKDDVIREQRERISLLEKKLGVAVEALEFIHKKDFTANSSYSARTALETIRNMGGGGDE